MFIKIIIITKSPICEYNTALPVSPKNEIFSKYGKKSTIGIEIYKESNKEIILRLPNFSPYIKNTRKITIKIIVSKDIFITLPNTLFVEVANRFCIGFIR